MASVLRLQKRVWKGVHEGKKESERPDQRACKEGAGTAVSHKVSGMRENPGIWKGHLPGVQGEVTGCDGTGLHEVRKTGRRADGGAVF